MDSVGNLREGNAESVFCKPEEQQEQLFFKALYMKAIDCATKSITDNTISASDATVLVARCCLVGMGPETLRVLFDPSELGQLTRKVCYISWKNGFLHAPLLVSLIGILAWQEGWDRETQFFSSEQIDFFIQSAKKSILFPESEQDLRVIDVFVRMFEENKISQDDLKRLSKENQLLISVLHKKITEKLFKNTGSLAQEVVCLGKGISYEVFERFIQKYQNSIESLIKARVFQFPIDKVIFVLPKLFLTLSQSDQQKFLAHSEMSKIFLQLQDFRMELLGRIRSYEISPEVLPADLMFGLEAGL